MKFLLLIAIMSTLLLAEIGKVIVVNGEASIERDVKVIKVNNDMGLFKQDIVETGDGRLQMHFNDNSVISLGKESRFIIEEYLYVNDYNRVAATFKIEKGFVKTITGAIGKMMPELFVFETSTTKITPNGTIWSVKVDENSEEYIVNEGKITLSFNDNKERVIELNAGESMILEVGSLGANKVVKGFKKVKIAKNDKKNSKEESSLNEESVYENSVEQNNAVIIEDNNINEGTIVNEQGEIVEDPTSIDDGNNGHGNDPDGIDPSNPGKGKSK
ncbi:FecR domain-containing protein [Candidatus Sulfurimonas marisnigri]|uniref:FecR domain-containing protein n=1 Tax=Candidatus Sulfurimonas marisnigri TaxID=2740405 RepID=A0A7S7M0J6_9BACT|nr:FecR domain-containing protein [Candidatus Sulfurimonas marisnigri]QOY54902.1 FecR domain-containing protein [Candidatus Sulfurimonas marisnigri]